MEDAPAQPLRLRAQDGDDLAAISSLMQDALIRRNDMHFDPAAKRFALAANRFCWEKWVKKSGFFGLRSRPERVRTMLRFDFVEKAQSRGLSADASVPLNLLAVTAERLDSGVVLMLRFSSDIDMALGCETIDVTLDDVSEPWRVKEAPGHPR